MGDRKRGRRIKEQWRKRGRKIESRVLEEKQIGGVGSCWWHFTAMNRVSTEVCFCYVCVKSIFWVLVSVSKNTRQRFANLRVGCRRIKKKKQKNRNGSQDPFHAFEKKKRKELYLAISIWTFLPLCLPLFLSHFFSFSSSSSLPPSFLLPTRFSSPQQGTGERSKRASGAVSYSSPSRFFFRKRELKLHSVPPLLG